MYNRNLVLGLISFILTLISIRWTIKEFTIEKSLLLYLFACCDQIFNYKKLKLFKIKIVKNALNYKLILLKII